MKATVKAARAQSDQGKSPFSAMACLLLLLLAGILVKFAVFMPFFFPRRSLKLRSAMKQIQLN